MGEIADQIAAEGWHDHCAREDAPEGVWIDTQGEEHLMREMGTHEPTPNART